MDQKRNDQRPEKEFLSEAWLIDKRHCHKDKDGSNTAQNNVKCTLQDFKTTPVLTCGRKRKF